MASQNDVTNMAVFCDFENVALGVRDARYDKFDIKRVLERLLLKGSIVVKKAYCDWDRYKALQAHDARGELRADRDPARAASPARTPPTSAWSSMRSTSATPRTTSTRSSSSPATPTSRRSSRSCARTRRRVIGVGVKNSTSDLLIANCDEFIYYDDLVREQKKRGRCAGPRRRVEGRDRGGARRGAGRGPGGTGHRAGEAGHGADGEATKKAGTKGTKKAKAKARGRRSAAKPAKAPGRGRKRTAKQAAAGSRRSATARDRRRDARVRASAVAQRGRAPGRGARPHHPHRRRPRFRAGRRRQGLGLHGEAGDQAREAGLQRVVLRVPVVQRAARGSAGAGPGRARARREVGRLRAAQPDDRARDVGLATAAATAVPAAIQPTSVAPRPRGDAGAAVSRRRVGASPPGRGPHSSAKKASAARSPRGRTRSSARPARSPPQGGRARTPAVAQSRTRAARRRARRRATCRAW